MLDSSRFPRREDLPSLYFFMPFVKLDTGILDSSLWSESAPTCKCWVTLLAMADCTGLVRSTAPGIAKRANLILADTIKALELFEGPDPHSRSLNDGGKKIERVDGGYRIINFGKYRDSEMRRLKRREYHREYWHKRKLKSTQKHSSPLNETQQNLLADSTLQKQSTEADKEKSSANGSRPTAEDLIKELSDSPAYSGIDVRREYAKASNWCKVNNKTLTVRRFVNWLNRAERPLPTNHAAKPDYKRNYLPPARKPTEAELKHAREIAKRETEKLRQQLGG